MATAPRPGSVRQEVEANQVILLSVDAVEQRLVVADIGPKDASRVRQLRVDGKRLGVTLAGLLQGVENEEEQDIDGICILWWLARVKAGEKLTYEKACEEFPSYVELGDRFEIGIEDLAVDDEDDSPEA